MNAPSTAQSWAWKFLDQLAEWRSLAVERCGFVQIVWVLVMLYFSTCTKAKNVYHGYLLCFMKVPGKKKRDWYSK